MGGACRLGWGFRVGKLGKFAHSRNKDKLREAILMIMICILYNNYIIIL